MDCHLSIRVADPVLFLGECRNREKAKSQKFQQKFTTEELASLRQKLREMRKKDAAQRAEREAQRLEWRKNSEREGRAFSTDRIGNFYSECRKADKGRWSVQWGKEPGEKGSWVVLGFDCGEAVCCFKMNMRVMDCWIAEYGEVIAVRLTNDLFEEKKRELIAFLDQKGQAIGQAQFPTRWFTFLGISETGTHYAWDYQDWLHVTDIASGMDFLNRKLPQGFYPNVADFDSETSTMRLRANGGMELKISWEDTPEGDLAAFAESFAETSRSDHQANLLRDFWQSHPEPDEGMARFLLPLLDEIEVDMLRDDSMWNTVTIPLYLRLGSEICEAAGETNKAAIFQGKLNEYRNPFDTANEAHKQVRVAIQACDIASLEDWRNRLHKSIASERLKNWPHLEAKCFRYLGEIAQHEGQLPEAQNFYSEALALDEAAGCKRSLQLVVKQLGEVR